MAVDFGNLNSGLRGSSGNTTWRRVRGRTIQSQKRGKNKKAFYETRAAAGLVRSYREAVFYVMSAFCDGMQNSINESFERTKYGSRRNAFFRLNYSAVEKALNGSELGLEVLDQIMHNVSFTGVTATVGEQSLVLNSFDVDGWDVLFSAASVAGVTGSYVRSTIGQRVTTGFDQSWTDDTDPSTATVTGFVANVNVGQAGQRLAGLTLNGTNLPSVISYSVRVGSPSATPLTGTWTGNTFTTNGASATQEYSGTYTIYITNGSRVLYSRNVSFYTQGAGGE